MSVNYSARSGDITGIYFRFPLNEGTCKVEAILMNIHKIPFQYRRKKITLNYSKSGAMGFFQGTQERVQNSRHGGKRATKVRAI